MHAIHQVGRRQQIGLARAGRRPPHVDSGDSAFAGKAGQLRVQATAEGSLLSIDLDGDRAADMQIRMIGVAVGATDLLL